MPSPSSTPRGPRGSRGSRGPRPSHSPEEIADAAIALADAHGADGLEAVSMRRVAAEIGAGTMSLYRYVANREALIALMIDRVCAEYDLAAALPAIPPPDWRAAIRTLAHQGLGVMRRHRWLPVALIGRQGFGPNTMAVADAYLAALSRTRMAPRAKMELFAAVSGLTVTLAQAETAALARGPQAAEHTAAEAARLGELLASGRYPHFAAVAVAGALAEPVDLDAGFDRMLDLLLR